jgi:hypothetical protein
MGLLHQLEYAGAHGLSIVLQTVQGLKSELNTASNSGFPQKKLAEKTPEEHKEESVHVPARA